MPRHWLLDREDPRAVLAASVIVLMIGILFATLGTGIPGAFLAVWLVVAAGQTIYANVRVRQLGTDDRRPHHQPERGSEPPPW